MSVQTVKRASLLKMPRPNVFLRKLFPYALIAPAMAFLIVFTVYPCINLVYLGFTDWNLVRPVKRFVGWQNYQTLFKRPDFAQALRNTAVYTVAMVVLLIVGSLLLAMWLKDNKKLNFVAQAAIFTPHIISLVSVSMVWQWLMEPKVGVLNTILRFLGLTPLQWLESSKTALMSVIIVSFWKSIGYYTLVVLSALQNIPAEIYEAAELDSASKWRTFYKITFPMISPQLFFLLIIITINSFKVFDTINIMTNGGPAGSTNVLAYYIYQYAFSYMMIGYASAAGTILLLILSVLTVLYFRVFSNRVHYQ